MITAGDVNLLLACLAVGVTVLWRRAEHRARTAEATLARLSTVPVYEVPDYSIQSPGRRVSLQVIPGGRRQ